MRVSKGEKRGVRLKEERARRKVTARSNEKKKKSRKGTVGGNDRKKKERRWVGVCH